MLTLPKLVARPAQPYVAIREKVVIPFNDAVDRVMPELFGTLKRKGIEGAGPVFFKYNIIKMPELEVEFAVPVATLVATDGRLVAGVLPAGRYAEVTYWGPYDKLMDVNAVLIGWARQCGIEWDVKEASDGDHFAARFEIYHNDPSEEPDPNKWETTVAIKVRD